MKCLECQEETDNDKFCCRSCANSFNNKGKRRHGSEPNKCTECGKKINKECKQCQKCRSDVLWREKFKQIEEGMILNHLFMKRYLLETVGQCSECLIGNFYNNKFLSLQLDHIDGNSDNNCLKNLRLLCPNCHSQTENWGSRNKGTSSRKNSVRKQWYHKN